MPDFAGNLGYSSQSGTSRTGPVGYIENLLRPVITGQYTDIMRRGPFGGSLTPGYDPFQEQAYGAGAQLYGSQFGDAASRFGGYGGAFGAGVPEAANYYRAALAGPQGFRPEDVSAFAYDPTLEASIGQGQEDIGRFLREQTLPGIGQNFRSMGQSSGSTRRGISEGLATQGAVGEAARLSTRLRGDAVARGQQFAAQEVARRQAAAQHAGGALTGGTMDFFRQGLGFGEQGVGGMLNLGADRRGIGQEMLAENYRQFYEPMAFFERYMSSIANPNFGRAGRTSQSGTSAGLGFGS